MSLQSSARHLIDRDEDKRLAAASLCIIWRDCVPLYVQGHKTEAKRAYVDGGGENIIRQALHAFGPPPTLTHQECSTFSDPVWAGIDSSLYVVEQFLLLMVTWGYVQDFEPQIR